MRIRRHIIISSDQEGFTVAVSVVYFDQCLVLGIPKAGQNMLFKTFYVQKAEKEWNSKKVEAKLGVRKVVDPSTCRPNFSKKHFFWVVAGRGFYSKKPNIGGNIQQVKVLTSKQFSEKLIAYSSNLQPFRARGASTRKNIKKCSISLENNLTFNFCCW